LLIAETGVAPLKTMICNGRVWFDVKEESERSKSGWELRYSVMKEPLLMLKFTQRARSGKLSKLYRHEPKHLRQTIMKSPIWLIRKVFPSMSRRSLHNRLEGKGPQLKGSSWLMIV